MTKDDESIQCKAEICGHLVTVEIEYDAEGKKSIFVPLRCDECLEKLCQSPPSIRALKIALAMGKRIAFRIKMRKENN